MDTTAINSAMAAAFSAGVKQPPTPVGGDSNKTVQVVTYQAPNGSGFQVIGRIKVGGYVATRVLNSGPDAASERDWPADIEDEAQKYALACVEKAKAFISRFISPLAISDGQQKMATRDLSTLPKTVAVATWLQTVKSLALAGQVIFPNPPFTEIEVLAE